MARAAQLAVRTPRRLTTRFWMRSLGWELAIAAAVLFALTSTRNGYLIAGVVAGVALLVGIPVKGRSLIGWAEGDLVQCQHLLSAGRTRSEEGEELDCAQSRLELLRRSRDFLLREFPLRAGGPHR